MYSHRGTMKDTTGLTVTFLDYQKVKKMVEKDLGINLDTVKYKYFGKERTDFLHVVSDNITCNGSVFYMPSPEEIEVIMGCETLKKILTAFHEYGEDYYYVQW